MSTMTKVYAAAACLLTAFILGLGVGWSLWQGKVTTVVKEVPAPSIALPSGTLVLEKKVAEKPTITHARPAGSTITEEGSVTIQPNQPLPPIGPVQPLEPAVVSKPITLNFAILRMPDGSKRVEFSSPDGRIVGGVDVVIEQPKPSPKPLNNAIGVIMGTTAWGDTAKGVFYDRDWRFLRSGAELTKNTYALSNRTGWETRVKVGIRF